MPQSDNPVHNPVSEKHMWATNGTLASKDHIALSEAYQTHALCGVGIVPGSSIRPKKAGWCQKCIRELKKLGGDPAYVGLYEPDVTDTGEDGEWY